jgi:TonB family protein
MFDRFGVGSPSPFGTRGGVLAVGVHVLILGYGLHATTGTPDPGKPYVAPPSIFVTPQAARGGTPVGLLVVPNPVSIDVQIPTIPTIIDGLPARIVERGPMPLPSDLVGTPSVGDPNGVYDSNVVEQPPELLASPPPRYPEVLRLAHVEGVVIVEGVVDTLGHMERKTLRVISSPHPALAASATECLAAAIFRPGRVEGRAVRVLVQVPVQFTVASH